MRLILCFDRSDAGEVSNGIAPFALFRGRWRRAAFRPSRGASPYRATRAVPPDTGSGKRNRMFAVRAPPAGRQVERGREAVLHHRTRDRAALNKESRRIVEAIEDSTLAVLLDLNGREWSSQELATQVRLWENDAVKEIAVVIGGPDGLSPEVQSRADVRWRLTRLTLTHEMARVLVLEQLYRAYAINRGLPYQK